MAGSALIVLGARHPEGQEAVTSTDQRDPGESPTLPPTTSPPQPLGSGYLLLEPIGAGATGRVWRGWRRADETTVAVKVLREEYAADPDIRLRFVREDAALRAVHHPNLVPVHELVFEKGDTLAIVMDFIDGENLRQLLSAGSVEREPAVALLGQLAGALAAVHRAGIVHRDVKPENVLVTRRGGHPWAHLTDFGLARITEGPTVTGLGQLLGTPAYVAPEVVTGQDAGPASDVYALGLTGYEMLAGRRPFTATNPAALLQAHVDAEPPRPAGLAGELWAVIRDCLAKDPHERPSADEFARRLTVLYGRTGPLPAGAPAPVPPKRPQPSPAPQPSAVPAEERPAEERPAEEQPREEQPAELITAVATRPAPTAAEPQPARRPHWRWIAAVSALALLGIGAGVWVRSNATPPTPGPSAASQPRPQLYELPVTATSPTAGTVRLDFSDASNLPGFDSYVVFRDNTKIDQVQAGQAPPYLVVGVDPNTSYCYTVAALLISNQPTPPAPKRPCLAADGRAGAATTRTAPTNTPSPGATHDHA